MITIATWCGVAALIIGGSVAWAMPEADPLKPRVPPDERGAAQQLANPLTITPETVAAGKALYEGKGTCANCHGKGGQGDGVGGMMLMPGPRNFANCSFHQHRSDGELFWVLKNGSPGTGMPAFVKGGVLSEEEAWTIITYERTFCQERRQNNSAK
jgi:mono/diheme cytochrome c family protein